MNDPPQFIDVMQLVIGVCKSMNVLRNVESAYSSIRLTRLVIGGPVVLTSARFYACAKRISIQFADSKPVNGEDASAAVAVITVFGGKSQVARNGRPDVNFDLTATANSDAIRQAEIPPIVVRFFKGDVEVRGLGGTHCDFEPVT